MFTYGKLLGNAFAGKEEIQMHIASLLNPLQLRIGKIIAIGPKKTKHFYPELATMKINQLS